jgi:proline utilization trans-activator
MASSIPGTQQASPKQPKRTVVACLACRERKVRCSGSCPCAHCVRRSAECVFEQDDRKVLVSENLLNQLKRKARDWEESQLSGTESVKRSRCSHDTPADPAQNIPERAAPEPEQVADDGLPSMTNPLVTTSSKFVVDYQGRKRTL